MPTERIRTRVINALMGLAAERPYQEIGLAEIAERAGMTLGALRDAYDRRIDILADFSRRIDAVVVDGASEAAGESVRDRLFDVVMGRFDALGPHRAALRSIGKAALRDPRFAMALNRTATVSQSWMMAAAGIRATGRRGAIEAQGLACAFASVMRVWLDDEDPGLARTMAALDRALDRGQCVMEACDRVASLLQPLKAFCRPRRSQNDRTGEAQAEAAT